MATILAVDDSVTMRKILEITFAGTDFQLVAVGSGEEATGKLRGGGVGVVICDNSLEGDGYEVARQLKAAAPSVPLLFLSSRQNPFDAGRGAAARVDDHMDKPFDTQQLIDRVNKLASGGASVAPSAAAPAASAQAPAAAPVAAAAAKSRTMAYGGSPAAPAATAPKTAGFGAGGLGAKPAPAPAPAARPAPAAAPAPAARPVAAAAPSHAPAAAMSAAVGAANGQLAAKVGEMGLSPQQADAILALSRDLIERIVWEVVPVMAEALIKEEIGRLTK